jgi:hypothetical protein
MRADVVLGFDPAPGDTDALAVLRDALHRTVRALVEARTELDRLGRTGSVWDGPVGAPIATLLRHYSRQLSGLEECLVDCLQALDRWTDGVESRQEQVAQIVESVAALAGDTSADDRRTRLVATAREIGTEHDRAAAYLAAAFEDLSASVEQIASLDDDLAGDLDRALLALTAAVDDWIASEAPELLRTAIALGEVAGLTTVISELVGIAALGRNPGDAEGVGEIIARSPGSHRLIRALRKQWLEVAPVTLPEATFAIRRPGGLADAMAGRHTRSIDDASSKRTDEPAGPGHGGSTGSGE